MFQEQKFMIHTQKELRDCLKIDNQFCRNYATIGKFKHQMHVSPISDQWYIWEYIKALRYCEYHLNNEGILHKICTKWYLFKLRRYARITGFQIHPNTIGPGVTIWHWGSIIINPKAKIGKNCTLNPMVIIGHKVPGEPAPQIGDNVFIGGGAKIIGNIKIGNNVTIAPNAVVVKNIPDNCIVGGVPAKIIRKRKSAL